ncbi:MAG: hypothetical protein U5O39_06515 [Gammaproteobacteria bacterium]|nr:hypothetical protein [Gammaproteobacteria bacterium]
MGCRVDVLKDLHLVLVVLYDDVSFDDLTRIRTGQTDNPDFNLSFHQLVVLPPDTRMTVSSEEFRKHAKRSTLYSPQSRRAMIAPDNPVTFGYARMFQLLKSEEAGDIHVFRSLGEACDYLDITPDALFAAVPAPAREMIQGL